MVNLPDTGGVKTGDDERLKNFVTDDFTSLLKALEEELQQ